MRIVPGVVYATEVEDALARRRPIVALETALVSHGFPGGGGEAVALEAEERIRAAGAVPATVGVLDGTVRVGLRREEIGRFAADPSVRKAGPRDLAACAVQGVPGATTVGGTLAVCRATGIGFLATGGIGGVHRGFGEHLDVSADLGALARTEALVVCSGPKSLLDVEATSEALESFGIPVLGWRTDRLPRFYAREGGPPVSAQVETVEEAARIARAHWSLGRPSGIVVARPPDPALGAEETDTLIAEALVAASSTGVTGQDITPFVLARLHDRSGGRTLEVNRRLIPDNAELAARIAIAYAAIP